MTEERRAEAEVLRLNAELEQRVMQRTAELEAANKEFESFAFSVSHDLRAPLRGIDGCSQVLLDDYGAQLDDEGRSHLDVYAPPTRSWGRSSTTCLIFAAQP